MKRVFKHRQQCDERWPVLIRISPHEAFNRFPFPDRLTWHCRDRQFRINRYDHLCNLGDQALILFKPGGA